MIFAVVEDLSNIDGETVQSLIAFGTLVLMALTAWVAFLGFRYGRRIDNAVNNRHPEDPKLYDLVISNAEHHLNVQHRLAEFIEENDAAHDRIFERLNEVITWKESYEGGPLDSGDKVVAFVEEVYDRLGNLRELREAVVALHTEIKEVNSP